MTEEQTTYEMKIELHIPEQQFLDFLTTAWEGGIDHWCDAYNPKAERNDAVDVTAITFATPEGDDEFNEPLKVARVDVAAIKDAFARVLNEAKLCPGLKDTITSKITGRGVDDIDLDASDCDNLVQIAVFGEIVYG